MHPLFIDIHMLTGNGFFIFGVEKGCCFLIKYIKVCMPDRIFTHQIHKLFIAENINAITVFIENNVRN